MTPVARNNAERRDPGRMTGRWTWVLLLAAGLGCHEPGAVSKGASGVIDQRPSREVVMPAASAVANSTPTPKKKRKKGSTTPRAQAADADGPALAAGSLLAPARAPAPTPTGWRPSSDSSSGSSYPSYSSGTLSAQLCRTHAGGGRVSVAGLRLPSTGRRARGAPQSSCLKGRRFCE